MTTRVLLTMLLLTTTSLRSAVIPANSASQSDVQDAVDLASDGDTVTVPAGSATWATPITLPTGVRLQGAGIDVTTLENGSSSGLLIINARCWVRDFTFVGAVGGTSDDLIATVGQDWVLYRILHRNVSDVIVFLRDDQQSVAPRGLIAECHFEDARIYLASPYINGMHAAHASPLTLGTTNAIYIESCTFTNTFSALNCIDLNLGSRMVVRSNIFHNTFPATHGIQTDDRGVVSWEFYLNRHVFGTQAALAGIGSGSGVIFSNSASGTASAEAKRWWFEFKRSYDSFGTGGRADGHSNWDGNLTNGITSAVGTHDGANNAVTLTDSTKATLWANDIFLSSSPPTYNRWIYNLTDGSNGQITDNTTTTVTVTLSGGTDNDWDTGDSYKITGGYPGRDQIGWGEDASTWAGFPTSAGPTQTLIPVYIWDNTGVTSPGTDEVELNDQGSAQTAFMLQEGREWIYDEHPTYTPLEYPHPLLASESGGASGTITFGGGTITQGGGTITFQ